MESLPFVERDGNKLFCFIEVCVALFPEFSKSTVRSWLKILDIPCVPCTKEERSFFRSRNPYLTGSFGLIYEKDVSLLAKFRDEKTANGLRSPKKLVTVSPSVERSPTSNDSSIAPRVAAESQPGRDNQPCGSNTLPLIQTDTFPPFEKFDSTAEHFHPLKKVSFSKTTKQNPSSNSYNVTPKATAENVIILEEETGCSTITSPMHESPADVASTISSSSYRCAERSGHSSRSFGASETPTASPRQPEHQFSQPTASWPIQYPSDDERAEVGVPTTSCDGETSNTGKRRGKYKLHAEDTPAELKQELVEMRKFYTSPVNLKRDGVPYSDSTMNKLLERVLCFFYFAKFHKNISVLRLTLFNSESLISDYVTYLSKVRKLMPSTIRTILSVAINVVKYNYRDDPLRSQSCSEIVAYRRAQRQLSRQARFISRRKKEGLTSKSSQQFHFAYVLETLRSLHEKHLQASGVAKARFLHDFVLIATYLRAMPGRSHEIRSLKLFVASETKPFDLPDSCTDNFIVFEEDNRVFLVQNSHKTVNTHGPIKLDISDDLDLLKYLNMYVKSARLKLLQGKSHDSFFVNAHGDSFQSSSAVSKYLGDLFEREVSARAGTNKLRHSIVTYFQSIDESKDVSVRESLAALMKHSVRYQSTVYNDTTQDEKTRKGRNLLRSKFTAGVFGDASGDDSSSESSEGSLSEGEEFEIRPKVNDICALVDPVSTPDNVNFFLAKIARYTPDGKEAFLIHLDQVENSENLYKLKPGKVWKEARKSLVYPVDVVYNSSENAYELRTSAEEIYQAVVQT